MLELLTYRIRCNYRRTWSPQRHRLENVHVCLVMDGVERPDQRAFFADMDMVTRFAKELQDSQLAASLMVAVVMSGPLPKSAAKFLASATDAYYLFRVDG